MKLTDYLGVSAEVLQDYINQGLVDTSFHPEFPLVLFTYSRKCVREQTWDQVTTKCRGLIANTETDDIVARPFEKFFNYGDPQAGLQLTRGVCESPVPGNAVIFDEPNTIYEKMDGFLCTLYEWGGKYYIASKGSFDSPHAKWATATLNQRESLTLPPGYTPVFEGITKNLRIVVDYGDREELILLGLINIETGEELSHASLMTWASVNGFKTPDVFNITLAQANDNAISSGSKNVEGYVAVWQRPGMTPFRLKIKYQDYLRIHRLVTGVSPKRVLEALVNGWTSELNEWTDASTPWFSHFIEKWRTALNAKYLEYKTAASDAFDEAKKIVMAPRIEGKFDFFPTRKQWAEEFKKHPEELHAILFAMLDGKNVEPVIWKKIKPMISGSHPMIDASKL